MNILEKTTVKIKRRNFFYYIGAAAVSTFVLSKFPFNIFKREISRASRSSIKVSENPYAVKRSARVSAPAEKGSGNG
ncbi:MAG TPA: hypothetical protein VGK25_06235 [Ignavibacteria bacterium]|jgi:hypothetical protein